MQEKGAVECKWRLTAVARCLAMLQSLYAVWKCLEKHHLFKEKQGELLDDVSEDDLS